MHVIKALFTSLWLNTAICQAAALLLPGAHPGCVQVHCQADKGVDPDPLRTLFEITLWYNGALTLYLQAGSDTLTSGHYIEWSGSDKSGASWVLRMWDNCSKMSFMSASRLPRGQQIQFQEVALTQLEAHQADSKLGQYCVEKKNGSQKCTSTRHWEATFGMEDVCSAYTDPIVCDFRGRCVSNEELDKVALLKDFAQV